jgi:hypothetical protein
MRRSNGDDCEQKLDGQLAKIVTRAVPTKLMMLPEAAVEVDPLLMSEVVSVQDVLADLDAKHGLPRKMLR